MKQINCIIVEDEIPAAEELKFLLNKYDFLNILAICSDGLTAMNIIKKHNPQAIFLDINIPVKNGMDLAKEIKDFNNDIQIIFVTAYEEHALEAFEIEALDYILKPFDEKRIQE
ncbi:transcriptional regulatory protein [Clostridium tetanomorphum DSM 665]|nr:transcriptional regulatory protein [Clostridium tetanomorphum DSM 665]